LTSLESSIALSWAAATKRKLFLRRFRVAAIAASSKGPALQLCGLALHGVGAASTVWPHDVNQALFSFLLP